MNSEVKKPSTLCEMKGYKFVHKFNIRILGESLKETRICDSQYPRGKCLAPAVKIPYRRPWVAM